MTAKAKSEPIRSMTGFAQVKGQAGPGTVFTLSLKSVNHRFLDLQMRMPSDQDGLEMKLRRELKEKLARGHIDLTLSIERGAGQTFEVNKELVGGYLAAFRGAAQEFGVSAEPDLNAVLKMPGALSAAAVFDQEEFDAAVLRALAEAVEKLNRMREEEGARTATELRARMAALQKATGEVEKLRAKASEAYFEKVQSRMRELVGAHADAERIMQEAALLAERSDIQEEIVRLLAHVQHFSGLLEAGGEVGKKLDFLLQEMHREANTLLSKTAGISGEGLKITELGLAMKSDIEKSREQVQNLE
jgi:uncharacterized protein (TIGR00255 family)